MSKKKDLNIKMTLKEFRVLIVKHNFNNENIDKYTQELIFRQEIEFYEAFICILVGKIIEGELKEYKNMGIRTIDNENRIMEILNECNIKDIYFTCQKNSDKSIQEVESEIMKRCPANIAEIISKFNKIFFKKIIQKVQ